METDYPSETYFLSGDVSGYTCLVDPRNCGTDGATMALWLKISECQQDSGVLSSKKAASHVGTRMHCTNFNGYVEVS